MGKIRLNLGAGIKPIKGFINVDKHDFGKCYIKADVRKLPFKDNYADYILASEILEHIPLKDLNNTLREWVRVLKPGGRMVIKCPDFDALAQEWLETPFSPEGYGNLAQGIYGNQITDEEFHVAPINRQFLNYYLSGLKLKGKIGVFPKGCKEVGYPGIKANPDRIYRFGEVHADVNKTL